jgi:hypothetical protein
MTKLFFEMNAYDTDTRIANEGRVPIVPPDDPQITERMWVEAAQSRFRGTVIVGRDLLEI